MTTNPHITALETAMDAKPPMFHSNLSSAIKFIEAQHPTWEEDLNMRFRFTVFVPSCATMAMTMGDLRFWAKDWSDVKQDAIPSLGRGVSFSVSVKQEYTGKLLVSLMDGKGVVLAEPHRFNY
jgi:hypothetical protein